MPAPPFPPTSDARFRVHGEEYAEGFVMDFDVTGSTFTARLDLPKPADPGEAYLIFYMSFYQEGKSESMIETGLSVSGPKQWNLLSKMNGAEPGADCLLGDHYDPRDHAPVDLTVTFGTPEDAKEQSKVAKGKKVSKHVVVTAAGRGRVDVIKDFKPIGRMRLIIAAANNKHGHFGTAGISLRGIDNKQPTATGRLTWMPGKLMTVRDSRIELIAKTSTGFTCELPAIDA